MLKFLREELTSLPKMVRTAFCLPSRPPAKGCPDVHAFGRVWECWSNNAHEAFPWVYA